MSDTYEVVRCNACGGEDGEVVADRDKIVRTADGDFTFRVRLVCCARCGLVYWSPRMDAATLERYYRAVFRPPVWPPQADDQRRAAIRSRVDWLAQHVAPGDLLEIGSGEGFFLERAVEAGFSCTGLEPSTAYAAVARKVAPQATVAASFIDTYHAPASADVVCSFFVLEHSLDGLDFLSRCGRYLRPGGRCVLEVPDVGRYGQQTGDMLWHEHTYHFSADSLARLLARAGFRVDHIESPGPSYQFGMIVLATHTNRCATSEENLPDHTARRRALDAFAAHRDTVGRFHEALRATVTDVLEAVRSKPGRLALYGTGAFSDQLFEIAGLVPADVAIVVDDNEAKWHTETIHGLRVEAPARLATADVDVVLIGSDAFEATIAKRARTLVSESAQVICPHAAALSLMNDPAAK